MVDVVVVMVNGKITETGSYDQLITHDGPFAQFLRQYFINEPDTEIENEHPDGKICCWGQLCVNLVLLPSSAYNKSCLSFIVAVLF